MSSVADFGKHDLTNRKFGRWKVISCDLEKSKKLTKSFLYWICQCECGVKRSVRHRSLTEGDSISCGCLQKEVIAEINRKTKVIHGETGTRLYRIWAGMKLRCNDPNQPAYPDYGGRGIQVCKEWNNYKSFRDWAAANGYAANLTIERKNVNGNYCPENCRFATMSEQAVNKRSTLKITAWGETKTIREWLSDPRCKIKNEHSLRTRYWRKQMSFEDMISRPPLHSGR